jgi:putative ATPase
MDELFSSGNKKKALSPLADRMRPQTLENIIGQDHIVGPGRLLRRAIAADRLSSIILYGPPGTGKTSLAAVIANTTRAAFENLNAVLSGVKDIREVIDRADERFRLYSKRTILFVDEVHRWNKAQQDALLPWVENGTVILVGATTENPFFEVNRALVSRSRIFQLKPLGYNELLETARRTVSDKERGYGNWDIRFDEGALEHLVEIAGGDARSLLNALELAIETSEDIWPPENGKKINISMETAEESIQRRALLYDRDGDYHFDTISAFIKSVRGSDPDAALYWLAKMVRAGEDPKFIFRRMIILASEDVGMADPFALEAVISCAQAFERIGFPEGNFPLAQACLYLATAPKSNTAMAFFDALKEVDKEDAEVPNHLRDASRDSEGFGHGDGYVYPHAYRDHWAAQQYLPASLRGKTFYMPSAVAYEGKIREEVLRKRELQAAIVLGSSSETDEFLSWSAAAKGREGWFKRLESGRSSQLLKERNLLFETGVFTRQDRVLIPFANDGLLLWESLRRCPEGLTACLVKSEAAKDALLRYASIMDEIEKPVIAVSEEILPAIDQCGQYFACGEFDHILIRRARLNTDLVKLAKDGKFLLSPKGELVLLSSSALLGERLSRILAVECGENYLSLKLADAEALFFNNNDEYNLRQPQQIEEAFKNENYTVKLQTIDQEEERLITEKDLNIWFNSEQSRWGAFIAKNLEKKDFEAIKTALSKRILAGPLLWKWKSILLQARK